MLCNWLYYKSKKRICVCSHNIVLTGVFGHSGAAGMSINNSDKTSFQQPATRENRNNKLKTSKAFLHLIFLRLVLESRHQKHANYHCWQRHIDGLFAACCFCWHSSPWSSSVPFLRDTTWPLTTWFWGGRAEKENWDSAQSAIQLGGGSLPHVVMWFIIAHPSQVYAHICPYSWSDQ